MGHAQWVFTLPKMLRVYFLHHRELLGKLSRAAAETVKELLAAAAGAEKGFGPGVVSVVATQATPRCDMKGTEIDPHHALSPSIVMTRKP